MKRESTGRCLGQFNVFAMGGLGNQLFQFAAACALSNQYGVPFRLQMKRGTDPYQLNELGIQNRLSYRWTSDGPAQAPRHSPFCRGNWRQQAVREVSFEFAPILVNSNHASIHGYLQSAKYFDYISADLRTFLKRQLKVGVSELPVVQVRLGDLVRNPRMRAFHGLLAEDYYLRGLAHLGIHDEAPIRVVTDGPEDVFVRLFPELARRRVTGLPSDVRSEWQALASASHRVIANSTWGWWAAWVGQGRTVAPQHWFAANNELNAHTQDLYLPEWAIL